MFNRSDGCVTVNFSATGSRTLGQCLGQISRLNIAIIGMLDGTENAVRFTERPNFFELYGCQQIHFDADGFSNARIIHKLIPAILGARETNVGDFLEANILARFNFQFLIEFH